MECQNKENNGLVTNIPLMKGTVPKRLDICEDFNTSININHFYLKL